MELTLWQEAQAQEEYYPNIHLIYIAVDKSGDVHAHTYSSIHIPTHKQMTDTHAQIRGQLVYSFLNR
jgi:hypothetical protein